MMLDLPFLEFSYQLLLERPIDAGAKSHWETNFATGVLVSRFDFVNGLLQSEEFAQVHDSIDRNKRQLKMERLIAAFEPQGLSNRHWGELVYRLQLNRGMSETEYASHAPSGRLSRWFWKKRLISSLKRSTEFQKDYLRVRPFVRLHNARQAWVAQLPQAQRVLDIGGSSPAIPEGALIELGYPHRPKQLIIFDKPPEEQFWGTPGYEQGAPRQFDWGEVRYIHGYAEDLLSNQALANERFDMIFMGQVVEHIHLHALPMVLKWIHDHLNPGGQFFCDTPNRLITRVQMGDGQFIDPDHKKEYNPGELFQLMTDAGFIVTRQVGLLQMPHVVTTQQFGREDYYSGELVCEQADQGYCFATHCVVK